MPKPEQRVSPVSEKEISIIRHINVRKILYRVDKIVVNDRIFLESVFCVFFKLKRPILKEIMQIWPISLSNGKEKCTVEEGFNTTTCFHNK